MNQPQHTNFFHRNLNYPQNNSQVRRKQNYQNIAKQLIEAKEMNYFNNDVHQRDRQHLEIKPIITKHPFSKLDLPLVKFLPSFPQPPDKQRGLSLTQEQLGKKTLKEPITLIHNSYKSISFSRQPLNSSKFS